MNDNKTSSNEYFFGIKISTWTTIILATSLGALIVFIALPFLLSLILPIIFPQHQENFEYLVDSLDGVSIVLALLGTIASTLSIIMTIEDKKRYSEEKQETEKLINSLDKVHEEIGIVHTCVQKTFEQNRALGLELCKSNIITNKADSDLGFSINVNKNNDNAWEEKTKAREIEND